MKNKYIISIIFCFASCVALAQEDTLKVTDLSELSLENLMNIQVISASGYSQTTNEAPSTITVISAQQIAERGYEQLEDALRDIPGIDMIHVNGYVPTLIYFRGMYGAENQRALLMIDGIAENNIMGTNDLAGPTYSLHSVERIEIIWGPASALYGANAFGGIINIISKKGGDINSIHAEQGFGSFNEKFEKISMGLRRGKWEFAVAGTLYSTNGPKFTNRDPNYSASFVDKAYSLNTTLSYLSKNWKTTLGYRIYKTPMGWGTYSNSPTTYFGLPSQGNGNLGTLGVVARDFRGEKAGMGVPYLRTYFVQTEFSPANKKLNFMARITYRETGHEPSSYIYITLEGRRMIRALVASSSNRIIGELDANYTPLKNHRISFGMQFSQDNVEKSARKTTYDPVAYWLVDGRDTVTNLRSAFLPREFDIRNNFGSYLQYMLQTKLLGKTDFTAGVRYDHNSYFGDAVSPRIVVVNHPVPQLTFKFQFGMAFRAPTNNEIYQAPTNFKLTTEKVKTYELNVIYAFLKNTLRAQVNLYRNELTDVIILGNLAGFTVDKNPGAFTIHGVEGILDMSLAKNFSAFLNLTYQDALGKNTVSGNSGSLPGVARIKGNAGFTTHVGNFLTLSLAGNWVGKRMVPATNPYGPVKGYILTNAVLSTAKLFNKRVTASINIHNIFNTTWLDPGFRTADGFLYSTVLEQPGRTILFKLGLDLQ